MNIPLLDTWLFLVEESSVPDFLSVISAGWSLLIILWLVFSFLGIEYIFKRRTLSEQYITLKKRYRRQVEAIHMSDTRYAEKLSLLIRKYFEDVNKLDRALRKTWKEIRLSEPENKSLNRLTTLLDTGSYDSILSHQESIEARRYILQILS